MNVSILCLAFALAAAPVPKADPLPPITEVMWKASAKNLRTLGIALHNYHDLHGHFPQNISDAKGKPLLSWRVQLLLVMELDDLFKSVKSDEPWDSEHNQTLLEKMPKAFAPVRVKGQPGFTHYLGFDGPDAIFKTGKPIGVASILDGCSNTAMLAEAEKSVPWTKPDDLLFDPTKDLPKLGGFFDGAFNMLMADGSVMRVKKEFSPHFMKAAITKSGGEVIVLDELSK